MVLYNCFKYDMKQGKIVTRLKTGLGVTFEAALEAAESYLLEKGVAGQVMQQYNPGLDFDVRAVVCCTDDVTEYGVLITREMYSAGEYDAVKRTFSTVYDGLSYQEAIEKAQSIADDYKGYGNEAVESWNPLYNMGNARVFVPEHSDFGGIVVPTGYRGQ